MAPRFRDVNWKIEKQYKNGYRKIKKRNPKHLSKWKNLSQSMDDDTYGEIYESDVQ
jgi:hypothetical protein